MQLTDKLLELIGQDSHVISITGGGGKTSLLKLLASAYKAEGKSVLLTTTTKIQSPKLFDFNQDYYFLDERDALMHTPAKGEIVFFAELHIMDPKKCISPRLEVLDILIDRYDVVIIEADGAKCLPLKMHTDRDPVMMDKTTTTIAVMGASAYNLKGDNVCFGYDFNRVADKAFFQFLIDDEYGVFKDEKGNKKILLINQCDNNPYEELKGLELKEGHELVFGSVKENKIYE